MVAASMWLIGVGQPQASLSIMAETSGEKTPSSGWHLRATSLLLYLPTAALPIIPQPSHWMTWLACSSAATAMLRQAGPGWKHQPPFPSDSWATALPSTISHCLACRTWWRSHPTCPTQRVGRQPTGLTDKLPPGCKVRTAIQRKAYGDSFAPKLYHDLVSLLPTCRFSKKADADANQTALAKSPRSASPQTALPEGPSKQAKGESRPKHRRVPSAALSRPVLTEHDPVEQLIDLLHVRQSR